MMSNPLQKFYLGHIASNQYKIAQTAMSFSLDVTKMLVALEIHQMREHFSLKCAQCGCNILLLKCAPRVLRSPAHRESSRTKHQCLIWQVIYNEQPWIHSCRVGLEFNLFTADPVKALHFAILV